MLENTWFIFHESCQLYHQQTFDFQDSKRFLDMNLIIYTIVKYINYLYMVTFESTPRNLPSILYKFIVIVLLNPTATKENIFTQIFFPFW